MLSIPTRQKNSYDSAARRFLSLAFYFDNSRAIEIILLPDLKNYIY
jgi:hypothetical protein